MGVAMRDPLKIHHATNAAVLARDLAGFVAGQLREALARRGQALLIVSGGSTPVPFFEALSREALDWPQVAITLADERWLPADHADSNERLVRAHLLQGAAAGAHWVGLFDGAASVASGLGDVAQRLARLPWPADVVVLGMGADGHTASLFPHDVAWCGLVGGLDAASRCLAVGAPALPNVPVPRVSLSPAALLDARLVLLHITGAAKLALLERACQDGAAADWPIRVVLQQDQVPVQVFHAP